MKNTLSATIILALMAMFLTTPTYANMAKGMKHYSKDQHQRARKHLRPDAKAGNVKAQYYLGKSYTKQSKFIVVTAAIDYDDASYWFSKAVEQEDGKWSKYALTELKSLAEKNLSSAAQNRLGIAYLNGSVVEKNKSKAIKWYYTAVKNGSTHALGNLASQADGGNINAKFYMGELHQYGYGSASKDLKKAFKFYFSAADKGDKESIQKLLYMAKNNASSIDNLERLRAYQTYDKNNKSAIIEVSKKIASNFYNKKSFKSALKYYKLAADLNDADSQDWVGYIYYNGKGVKVDYAVAVKWYQKAVDQNYESAINNMAYMYYQGYGVGKNQTKAFGYYKKTADNNNKIGQDWVGFLYEKGRGTDKDINKAIDWYDKSAKQGYKNALQNLKRVADSGNANAQVRLGYMYDEGKGVKVDDALAVKYYQKAANGGNDWAMRNLGLMYEYAEGTTKNLQLALKWYKKSGYDTKKDIKRVKVAIAKAKKEALAKIAKQKAQVAAKLARQKAEAKAKQEYADALAY